MIKFTCHLERLNSNNDISGSDNDYQFRFVPSHDISFECAILATYALVRIQDIRKEGEEGSGVVVFIWSYESDSHEGSGGSSPQIKNMKMLDVQHSSF